MRGDGGSGAMINKWASLRGSGDAIGWCDAAGRRWDVRVVAMAMGDSARAGDGGDGAGRKARAGASTGRSEAGAGRRGVVVVVWD